MGVWNGQSSRSTAHSLDWRLPAHPSPRRCSFSCGPGADPAQLLCSLVLVSRAPPCSSFSFPLRPHQPAVRWLLTCGSDNAGRADETERDAGATKGRLSPAGWPLFPPGPRDPASPGDPKGGVLFSSIPWLSENPLRRGNKVKGLTRVNSQYVVIFVTPAASELDAQVPWMRRAAGAIFHLLRDNHVLNVVKQL